MTLLNAIFNNLTVQTNRGPLNPQQLCTLSLSELDTLAVSLEEKYENSKGKSFLTKKTKKDRDLKLQFDVVYMILQEKISRNEKSTKILDTKAHNQKIDELIAKKQEENLSNLSVKELEKLRR